MLTPSQKLREAEEDEAAAAAVEDTPHHTSWGGRGRRGATGPSPLYPADSIPPKRKRAQVWQCCPFGTEVTGLDRLECMQGCCNPVARQRPTQLQACLDVPVQPNWSSHNVLHVQCPAAGSPELHPHWRPRDQPQGRHGRGRC